MAASYTNLTDVCKYILDDALLDIANGRYINPLEIQVAMCVIDRCKKTLQGQSLFRTSIQTNLDVEFVLNTIMKQHYKLDVIVNLIKHEYMELDFHSHYIEDYITASEGAIDE